MIRKSLLLLGILCLVGSSVEASMRRPRKNRRKKPRTEQVTEIKQAETPLKVESPKEITNEPIVDKKEKPIVEVAPKDMRTPEQIKADSLNELRERLRPKKIHNTSTFDGLTVLDTLESGNDAVQVVLFGNNTWKYVRNRDIPKDSLIFVKYWTTNTLFPYAKADLGKMPNSVVIELVDSTNGYHCPYQGPLHPHGKYGVRRRRAHQGVDIPLKMGAPIYATFSGRVRVSLYNRGGYGNLIIIRHDNGLETYYGHLSERLVEPEQWVEAGQVIGYGGSTGRSTGPHLHFETRYYGQSFDPERLINFKEGILCRETFLLKKNYFSIYSKAGQNFEDEIANIEDDKREAAERAARRYHTIRRGDTLGHLARKYGTTVGNICRMNGIRSTTILRLGRKLRVR